jgi:hypothetical protein
LYSRVLNILLFFDNLNIFFVFFEIKFELFNLTSLLELFFINDSLCSVFNRLFLFLVNPVEKIPEFCLFIFILVFLLLYDCIIFESILL